MGSSVLEVHFFQPGSGEIGPDGDIFESGTVVRETDSVRTVGEDVNGEGNLIPAQSQGVVQRVFHRNGCILRGMPEEGRRRIGVDMFFTGDHFQFRVGRRLSPEEVLE